MKNIIKRIISKDLCRDNDEAYAGGFWDRSNDVEGSSLKFQEEFSEQRQEAIYNDFWEIVEETTKQILEKQNEKLMKISP